MNMLPGGGGSNIDFDTGLLVAVQSHSDDQAYSTSSSATVSYIGYTRMSSMNDIKCRSVYANGTSGDQQVVFYALENCTLNVYSSHTSTSSSNLKHTVNLLKGHKYSSRARQYSGTSSSTGNYNQLIDETESTTLFKDTGSSSYGSMRLLFSAS